MVFPALQQQSGDKAMATQTKKPAAKKAAAKKSSAKKVAADKVAAKKVAAKKPMAKVTPVKAAPAKKTVAKKAPARKAAVSRGMPAAAGAASVAASMPPDFFSAYTGAPITDADYAQAAQALGCEAAAIKAVAEVETRGAAFDASNRPTILYERHIFAKSTVPPGKFNAAYPDLSANTGYGPGGYGTMGQQYGKLARAFQLDPDAALKAPSWGKFQILGVNFRECGYATVAEFVKAMTTSEREHLLAFVKFVASSPARLQALRNKDWAGFALRYNGPEYAKFSYDKKMAAAYAKFAA
jgi:hypothetical protein